MNKIKVSLLAGVFALAFQQQEASATPGERGLRAGSEQPELVLLAAAPQPGEAHAAQPAATGAQQDRVPAPPRTPAPPAVAGGMGGGYGMGAGMAGAPAFRDRLNTIIARAGGGGPNNSPLLILSSEIEPEDQENLQEDMSVMAHLLQRSLGEATGGGSGKYMGVDLVFAPAAASASELYVEGYGVVFVVRVPFPLQGTGGAEEKDGQEADSQSEWEQARRELLGDPMPPGGMGSPVEPFRQEKVERLKQVLLEAMKNASNIRGLKPDEFVTVCAVGPSEARGGTRAVPSRSSKPGRTVVGVRPGAEQGTMLTIRLSKSDIESLAKGKAGYDEMRKKAKISAYWASTGEGASMFGAAPSWGVIGLSSGMAGVGTAK